MRELKPQQIQDRQILDSTGRNSGKVDGVEIHQKNKKIEMTGLLVGSEVWLKRLPSWLSNFLKTFIRNPTCIRIPFREISHIDASVHLKKKAEDYGLGNGDNTAQKWLEKIPGA